ncbi:cysteine hydrolase family protein [Xenorhabdus stockiae]|uniref:cysteine hydrolase family protein n=1 Tax=Xenorhabdus stockiae TaxID=351614 RepID=UPI00406357E7
MTKKAILVLDVINDLVHPEGSVGKDGFYKQAYQRGLIKNIDQLLNFARKKEITIIYVVVGFNENYNEWSPKSKLFKHVKEKKQIILGEWSTQIHEDILPQGREIIIQKNRIDPFFNTNLDLILRTNNIEEIVLTGVSSEFVVLSTALSAHDRDYNIVVLEDCISSSDLHSHECAIHIINKIADVMCSTDFKTKVNI